MRRGLASVLFAVTVFSASGSEAKDPKPDSTSTTSSSIFPIETVISQVKKEIAAAQSSPGSSLNLKLDTVDINFALGKVTESNGKASIGIPVFGGAEIGGSGIKKIEESSSLALTLAPPANAPTMSGIDTSEFGITQAIVETRQKLILGLSESPQLEPVKVVMNFKFVATRTRGGTGQIKFLVFTVGGGSTVASASTNSIALTFSKAKPLQ